MKKADLPKNLTTMSKVNLDALIPKADFIAHREGIKNTRDRDKLHLFQLLQSHELSLYHLLKKPDFQRETSEWDMKRIGDLIECFIEKSFIPAIILWENEETGLIYVIDGAHRLSALLAYINNDYGFGSISHEFNGYVGIPEPDKDLAKETEDYVNKRIGSYQETLTKGGIRADNLKQGYFDVQMITGDVKKAEDSFFKINQQGVILSPTEKALCKLREYPSCIATRVIMKGKSAHQYTKNFKSEIQSQVLELGDELNKILFTPPFKEETKSIILHHPLGGHPTNAMPSIFELMKIIKEKYKSTKKEEKDALNGTETLDYLIWARKLIWKTLSEKPGSLGLFPSIYFYNTGGKFIHSAFLGMMQLLVEHDGQGDEKFLPKFTKVRSNLEDFLKTYKVFLGQINAKFGSKQRSFRHLKGFYSKLIDLFESEYPKPFAECQQAVLMKIKETYPFLNERDLEVEIKANRNSKEFRTFLNIKDELDATARCGICNGFLHPFSKDRDHKLDKKLGGIASVENSPAVHYYCNNSKDKLISLGIYNPIN